MARRNRRTKRNNNANTRNPQSDLFKALTRVFSGPLVNRRTQTGRRLRRYQLDKYQSRFRSASGQEFKTAKSANNYNLQLGIMNAHNRVERYVDFDQMEYKFDLQIFQIEGYRNSLKPELF